MKLQVIGCGVVGWASGQWYARYRHDVTFVDRDPKALEKADRAGFSGTFLPDITGFDAHIICVPEDNVPSVVGQLWGDNSLMGVSPIVIRSTVLPGTTVTLARRFGKTAIFHNPETLREATALDDALWCHRTLIGYLPEVWAEHLQTVARIYQEMGVEVELVCGPDNTEMTKLALNAHLATLISYWNELHLLCEKLGINSHLVGRLLTDLDARVSRYGALKHGEPYGLRCLPKDTRRLNHMMAINGLPHDLLDAVEAVNALTSRLCDLRCTGSS